MKVLTAAAIERFKPHPAKRREIADAGMRGLYLIVQPSGAKSWACRFRLRGKPVKFTIGPHPAYSLAQARQEAASVIQSVQRGGDPFRERDDRRRAEAPVDTFEVIARQWIERVQRPKRRSWLEAARRVGLRPDREDNTRLVTIKGSPVDRWRGLRIADITRRDVIAVVDDLVAAGTPIAANRTHGWLHALFAWAISRDLIAANPATGIARQEETSRDRVLSDSELKAVWTAAAEMGEPWAALVQMLILTGQRREAVAGMMWSEIDLEARVWTLPKGRVKNATGHAVPLSEPAVAILKSLRRIHGSGLVFTLNGVCHVSSFGRTKARLDALSGVTSWTLHDIRRTVATGLQRLGVRLEITESVLNHISGSRGGLVAVYQRHQYGPEKRQALDAWSRYVTTLIDGAPDNVVPIVAGLRAV